jgi:hypothetical protein
MCHFPVLVNKAVCAKITRLGSAITLIASTNSRQFIAFLMASKSNIVLHDALLDLLCRSPAYYPCKKELSSHSFVKAINSFFTSLIS